MELRSPPFQIVKLRAEQGASEVRIIQHYLVVRPSCDVCLSAECHFARKANENEHVAEIGIARGVHACRNKWLVLQ